MSQALLVGLGGFFGAIFRYLVSGWVYRWATSAAFPHGTLAVNVVGCFVIGLASGLAEVWQVFSPGARLFFFIGFLGSFTTFSTFGYETLALARDAEMTKAAANCLLHLGLGLAAVWLGAALARGL